MAPRGIRRGIGRVRGTERPPPPGRPCPAAPSRRGGTAAAARRLRCRWPRCRGTRGTAPRRPLGRRRAARASCPRCGSARRALGSPPRRRAREGQGARRCGVGVNAAPDVCCGAAQLLPRPLHAPHAMVPEMGSEALVRGGAPSRRRTQTSTRPGRAGAAAAGSSRTRAHMRLRMARPPAARRRAPRLATAPRATRALRTPGLSAMGAPQHDAG
jgi:hypothetical protein